VLDERERSGVTVDVCQQCRGVWLDRGELEKLLAYAKRELDEERAHYGGNEREPPSSDRRPGRPHHDERHGQYKKKKGWLENLGDIFD
jgi:Zn-finger nucleic acid-binding protein